MAETLTDIEVQLTGKDGNAFAILAIIGRALRQGGRADLVEEFNKEAMSGDYDHLLQTAMKYCIVN